MRAVMRSRKMTQLINATTAGIAAMMTPADTALVMLTPNNMQMENRKLPKNDCRNSCHDSERLRGGSPALRQTDQAIVTAGTAADPDVIVMDPLAGRWMFPRAGDGLHPTAAGDAWIARTVAASLRAHGVRPAPATSAAPVICDVSVGAGKPVSATA